MRNLFNFLLFGNIYVALGTAALVQSTRLQLQIADPLLAYTALAFFSTIFIYNLQRVFYKPQKDNSLHSVRRKWIFSHQRSIRILTATGLAGSGISFLYAGMNVALYLSPLLILSIAYFIPGIRLRKSPWMKLLTLVTVWTLVTAAVPALLAGEDAASADTMLHLAVRLSFMIAICIPFDIRDMHIDKADTISTLPQVIGETNTRNAAITFTLIYILLLLTEYLSGMFGTNVFAGLLVSAVITGIFVAMSHSRRSEYFYVAGLDGTMIFQGLLVLLSSEVSF